MDKIIEILREINSDIDYEKEKTLVDDGFFSSLEIMLIVVKLNEYYHIEIDPDDILPENFNSVEAIKALIKKNQQ